MDRRSLATLVLVAATFVGASADGQWPQFRGADAGVAADDPTLPDTWSATDNAIWKMDLPGLGWSSPIVWGDVIFVTSVVSAGAVETPGRGLYFNGERPASTDLHRWMLYAIDFKTGRIRWEREVKRAAPMTGKHVKNTYASETPVTDGERVYAYFASAGLFAFDFSGAPIWSRPLDEMKTRNGWGSAASPVLDGDRVYLVNDNDAQSFIAAFDKRTGAPIWRVERAEGTNWSSPFVWRHDRGAEIVTAGTGRVRSYTLDGVLKWELKGMSSITVPTPFAKHGLLYVISGYPGDSLRPVYAIRPGATGDISLKEGETSNQHIAWFNKTLGTYSTTAVVYGDYLYTLLDRGFLMCNDAKTGQPVYGRQRVAADASGFTASPWAYNGKIFLLSEDGDTFVVQAGPEFKVLRKNSLGEMVMATPAIARGSLIIRTASKLYRIGGSI